MKYKKSIEKAIEECLEMKYEPLLLPLIYDIIIKGTKLKGGGKILKSIKQNLPALQSSLSHIPKQTSSDQISYIRYN